MQSILKELKNERIKEAIIKKDSIYYNIIDALKPFNEFKERAKKCITPSELQSLRMDIINAAHNNLTYQSYNGEKITNADAKLIIFQTLVTLFLFPPNSFINFCQDDTMLATDAYEIIMPQFINNIAVNSGDPYNNLTTGDNVPFADVVALTGSYIKYAVDLLKTQPIGMGQNELINLPYDKQIAVMESMMNSLKNQIPEYVSNNWALPTSDIAVLKDKYLFYETTGAARDVTASATAYTGLVKKLTIADIFKVKAAFHMNNIEDEIHALISPSNMVDFISELVNTNQAFFRNTGYDVPGYKQYSDSQGSTTVEFQGITFHERQSTNGANVYYTYADGKYTRVSYGAVLSATASPAMVFWAPKFVRKAMQSPTVFMLNNHPQTYGTIVSMTARIGAARWREDFKGVVMLAEKQTTA